jgi:PadR family transcriptional regulator
MQDVELTLKSARIVRIFLEDPAHPRYQLELMRYARMGSGTLWPILARLTGAGWLAKSREDVDPVAEGRPRRMLYALTPEAIPVARAKLAAIGTEFAPLALCSELREAGGRIGIRRRAVPSLTGQAKPIARSLRVRVPSGLPLTARRR